MPTAAQQLAAKASKQGDRFSQHALTAGMLFYRDVINKEMMAREQFEAEPPVDYKVMHLWRAATGRREEEKEIRQESRHWRLPYPWTSARVDRADVDGLHHASGVRTYHNKRDTWYNVMHRDATALSRFHRDKADRPPSRGHMPRYLDAQGNPVSSVESARIRAEWHATRLPPAHPPPTPLSQRLPLESTRQRARSRSRPQSAAAGARRRGRSSARSSVRSLHDVGGMRDRGHGRSGGSSAWGVDGSAGYAKRAVERALQAKRVRRKSGVGGGGGMSYRSLSSNASNNTWRSLGHTARSSSSRRRL